ncbi:MAG: gliding motility-associated C-terminal domain-containing protein [Bacteroidetes bacterium]|nr:gliding motility-associated C-terminal domain-containing protein [Bacteroidota bacterium]
MKYKILLFAALIFIGGSRIFSQDININATNNGQTFSQCAGTVYDDMGTANYSNNANWTVTICAPVGQQVLLTFTQVELESSYDYLTIYNGSSTASPILVDYTGSHNLAGTGSTYEINSTGGCLTLEFTTDGSVTYAGFTAAISCITVPPPTGCEGNDPASDFCYSATFICNDNGYCGNTSATYTVDEPGNLSGGSALFTGSLENNSWITFEATATDVSFELLVTNCQYNDGIQFAVYSATMGATDCDNFVLLSDPAYTSASAGNNGSFTITATGLTIGQTYYIMIDGFAGDVCDYEIQPGAGIFDGIGISYDQVICYGDEALMGITNPSGAGTYTYNWTSSPVDATLTGQTAFPQVSVTPTNVGTNTYYCHVTGGTANCPVDSIMITTILVLDSLDDQCQPHYECNINAQYSPSPVCAGDAVQIWLDGGLSTPVMSNDFNNGQLGVGWESTVPVDFTNPCYTGPDGSICLWMGDAAPHPRELITQEFDLVNGGSLEFDIRYPIQTGDPADAPCEGPDLSNEGVSLQYSTAGLAGPWVNIAYFAPDGTIGTANPTGGDNPGNATQFTTSWYHYSTPIPAGAQTTHTRFRFSQIMSSTDPYDHWGLDNVIIMQDPPAWSCTFTIGTGGVTYSGIGPHTIYPQASDWVYVSANTPDGFACYDSVWVEVTNLAPAQLSGLAPAYCLNEPPVTVTVSPPGGTLSGPGITGTTFDPAAAGVGTHTITYTNAIVNNGIQDTIWFDGFSTSTGWTGLGGAAQWQGGPASASSGCSGSQDPPTDHTWTSDNIVAGNAIGGCYPASLSTTYYLTSPTINLTGKTNVKFRFWRFAGCESSSYDHMNVQAKDAGGGWHTLWSNAASFSDAAWTLQNFDVSAWADNNPTFQVRFGMGSTDGSVQYMGWNIDDVTLIGDFLDTVCQNDTSVQVTVGVQPNANAGTDTVICDGNSATLTATGGATFIWNTGPTTPSITVSPLVTTTYTVTVANGGCIATDDVTVNVMDVPNPSFTGLQPTYCSTDPADTLIGTPTGGTFSGNGISGNVFTPLTAGAGTHTITYSYYVTDTVGIPTNIFFDDLTANLGWTGLGGLGEWERAATIPGSGCFNGANYPTIDNTPYSTDNFILGTDIGECYSNSLAATYYVTSPTMNCTGYTDVALDFYRWASIESSSYDHMYVEVSTNNFATTNIVWQNTSGLLDTYWTHQTIDISAYANNQANVKVRFGIGTTDASGQYMGWNIDDFKVFGRQATGDTLCLTSIDQAVTVNAVPNANAGPDVPVCRGTSTLLTASGGGTYLWSTNETNASISVAPNTTTTYYVTVTNSGCTDADTVIVTVNPLPNVLVNPNNASICPGSSINLTASGANTYSWAPDSTLSASTGATVVASPWDTEIITVTGTNTTTGCSKDTTVTVFVNLAMTIDVDASAVAVCSADSISLSAYAASGTNFTWDPATGLSATTGSTVLASPAGNTTYTVTGVDPASGCTGDTTITVQVNPNPVIVFADPTPSFCIGGSTMMSASGAGPGGTYSWEPLTGITGANGDSSTITISPSNSLVYTVTGTNTLGCSDTAMGTVTIFPLPNVAVSSSTGGSVCTAQPTTLTANGAATYTWAPSGSLSATSGNPVTATPTSSITVTVNGTDANGCVNSATIAVAVLPPPTIVMTPHAVTFCQGTAAQISASGGGGASYSWSPTTGITASTPDSSMVTVQPNVTTTYTIIGTNAQGCTNDTTVTVTVNPLPTVTVNPASVSICIGTSANLTAGGAVTYIWSPNLGLSASTGVTVTASPTTTTTYTVQGEDANGCKNTVQSIVTVNANPNITVATVPTICTGDCAQLDLSGAVTYIWAPTTGLTPTSGASVNACPTVTTTYTIIGQDGNLCPDTLEIILTVNQPPAVYAEAIPDEVCLGQSTMLKAYNASTYEWAPTATVNPTTGNIVYATPTVNTTYTVTAYDNIGCTNSATVSVSVNPLPNVSAVIYTNDSICLGQNVTFKGFGAESYTWAPNLSLSVTAGLEIPVLGPSISAIYTVTGTDTNGCTNTFSFPLTVLPLPSVSATASPSIICPGDSSLLSAAGADAFFWSPTSSLTDSVGPQVTTGTHHTTTYTVKGFEYYGGFSCTDSATVTVTVSAPPTLSVIPPSALICPGAPINLTATGAGPTGSYTWSPTNAITPTTGQVVTASPNVTTTYTINGTDGYGCSNTTSIEVSVYPPMQVTDISPEQIICVGETTTLYVIVDGGDGSYNYNWSNGVSSTTSQANVAPGATSTYVVTISDNCTSPIYDSILVTVNNLPVVNFFAEETDGCAPFVGWFHDLSTPNIVEWNWNFGDIVSGIYNSSHDPDPTHSFGSAGYYSITLSVKSSDNCVNTLTLSDYIYVTPKPEADFYAEPWTATILDPTIDFFDQSIGGVVSWLWSFGDSLSHDNFSTLENPDHLFTGTGEYHVTLIVSTPDNCKDTVIKDVIINDDFTFFMPNAFRPDGDGLNDVFGPQGINLDYDGYEMYVYDRWGSPIFYSTTPEIGWDGRVFNSIDIVPNGVYVWMIIFRSTTGDKYKYIGHVTVLHDTKK